MLELTTQIEESQSARHSTPSVSDLVRERSPLWTRMQGGLKLFGIKEENVSGMTAFRLAMVHRPRFTTLLYPPTQKTSGTFGFLLGDAANAIHFWPGRGLNSGIASAISLARCMTLRWREADSAKPISRVTKGSWPCSSIAQEPGLASHGDHGRDGNSVRDQEQDKEGAG